MNHTMRARDGGTVTIATSRARAIACFCTECLGWETNPKDCTSPLCALYPFRRNTTRTRQGHVKARTAQRGMFRGGKLPENRRTGADPYQTAG